ncbi:MAG: SprT-like domain-containing protein [Chlamydiota bacterium]
MFVYSPKIIRFIQEIKSAIRVILSQEMRLKVVGERFYDRRHKASYPIVAVIYNNKSMLGYFDPEFYELGFHERLMHASKEQLHEVIRHELAHYLTFILHGPGIQPHGPEFRALCAQMGWGEGVYRASTCLESGEPHSPPEENSVLRKVQKLMALATSSNENEAQQAMIRSRQLLLKHNIEFAYTGEEEKMVLKRIMKQKKENAKMRSIAVILETFFVTTIYRRTEEAIYLEILGNASNVEIAEYVADFLERELELQWLIAKREARLKGVTAKNSFFLGLAKGYCNQIQALKREYPADTVNAVMVIEKQLEGAKAMVYKRLSSSRSHGSHCQKSANLGERAGKELRINPAIQKTSNKSPALIT